jgi:hypothetical protein
MTSGTFGGRDWIILADHVAPFDPIDPNYVSTFNAAVREARSLSARDPDTGMPDGGSTSTLWAAAIVYLILLEQVGKSLRPLGGRRATWKPAGARKPRREPDLEKAIRQFAPSAATKSERQVLYALRCAFAHDFGLFNVRGVPPYRRVFRLDDAPGGPLVSWPRVPWTGKVMDARLETSTTVNLVAFAEVVEAVVRSVRAHSARTTLRPEMPTNELQRRFGFRIEPENP